MVIAGDAAVEEPKEHVVADMDPEAEAEQGKSRAVGDEEKKEKSDDDAVGFRELCHSLAEKVHANLEEWPYLLPEGDDLGALDRVPTHGPPRHVLAQGARAKFQTWWEKATAAADKEKT